MQDLNAFMQAYICAYIHSYIHTYIHTYLHIYMHACMHACIHTYIRTCIHTYIHICWFNFDALAQEYAYKPTKEPINYRGPGGDRTHDLQTEATPQAASCPARSLHATEIMSKIQFTKSPADWMSADKPTELSRTKLKTWTQQLIPMISEHSAQSIPLPIGFRTWVWRYTCLLLFILMLWHRQAIFESTGEKLSSAAECRIRTQGLWNRISSRLNARWQTDWAIEDQAKNLNSIARPYDQRAFSPLDPTAGWLSHLALAIYMFVVVNFDTLAQASDFLIERRQFVFICWMANWIQSHQKRFLCIWESTPVNLWHKMRSCVLVHFGIIWLVCTYVCVCIWIIMTKTRYQGYPQQRVQWECSSFLGT